MKCPRCGFSTTGMEVEKLARKQGGNPIYIKLFFESCNRKNCGYSYSENYHDKINYMRLKPY